MAIKKRSKLIIILTLLALLGSISGCGKKNIEEYSYEDLSDKLITIRRDVDEETKYWTDEELSEKGFELTKKIAQKNGLNPGERIRLRGRLAGAGSSSLALVADDGTGSLILCEGRGEYIFLEENQNVYVEGTIFANEENTFSDTNVISPQIKIPEYENNIELASQPNGYDGIVTGRVFTVDDSDKENYDSLIMLTIDENAENMPFVVVRIKYNQDLSVGDKISVKGSVDSEEGLPVLNTASYYKYK